MSAHETLKVNAATLSKLCGITRQSVYGAEKSGLLVKVDNYFSLEEPKNIEYLEGHGGDIQTYLQTLAEDQKKRYSKEVEHRDPVFSPPGQPEKTKDALQKKLIQFATH